MQNRVTVLQEGLLLAKRSIAEKNKHVQKRVHEKENLLSQITECELKIKELGHKLKKLRQNHANLETKRRDLAKSHSKLGQNYIKEAEKLTEVEGNKLENTIRKQQEEKTKLSRTVNAKAQNQFEQEEKIYTDTRKKQRIVEQDRKKLESIIKDLDRKKEETLRKAYQQISKDFGSIFGTLLPGAGAKLMPPTGQSILQGMEVRLF